ncbi:MAG: class I poly(R)-hydroxyalkanoic acid synthase, partial [Gammaproteobacteria bacterium]|nr:class I poly(R)-hydroxyalkanoic acid synthase [Gammaproteobacteria bacterium]
FDLLFWNADGSNLPGRLYAWYLRNMYLENNLRIPGKLILCDVPVDLGAVNLPAYVMAAREDHIVPWRSAYLSTGLLGGKCVFVLAASGHVAGVVNPASGGRRQFWTRAETPPTPDAWFGDAVQRQGSWWPHWAAWLKAKAGGTEPAPTSAGNPAYPVIEPAPGRYIKQKIA